MTGLIVKKKWLELILDGLKDWEIRGSSTAKRGTVYLIQSGSGLIMGQVDITDCIRLDKEQYERGAGRHLIDKEFYGLFGMPYTKTYAWVLKNPVRYKEPIPYKHPQWAVIWVANLPERRGQE